MNLFFYENYCITSFLEGEDLKVDVQTKTVEITLMIRS